MDDDKQTKPRARRPEAQANPATGGEGPTPDQEAVLARFDKLDAARRTRDPEITAMEKCQRLLEHLEPYTADRVASWLVQRARDRLGVYEKANGIDR